VCFQSAAEFFDQFTSHQFRDEYILLKGARIFEFEKISHWLEQKVHQTVLEVNLTALIHNLKVYQAQLKPATKVMAMVKAFSYGSGTAEVARVLQFHKVDYLAVAYADEGVELRKAGISLPIMVMNPDELSFDAIIEYNLEPEIYGLHILNAFSKFLSQQGLQQFPVHIKIDTGMHRLGFELKDMGELSTLLSSDKAVAVRSVFSHLVASEAAEHDEFTRHQANLFNEACKKIQAALEYDFIRHVANSSAINRHPDLQYDMVRLGIGLYGVDSSAEIQEQLQTVAVLRSTISQIRNVAAGETVGYNRRGVVKKDSVIATVRIGYADGLTRHLGNGKGKVWLHGKTAPVIGNVCMDMTMIDITGIPGVSIGDEVEIFGSNIPVQQVAEWSGTIAYEILTSVSQRVKRVYVEE
jgi:alanine racemase